MNRKIQLPYGDTFVELEVPEDKLIGVFEPRSLPPAADSMAELRRALANPVNAPRLREKAKGARSVVIVVEDATRPVPVALLLDAVMEELQAAGIAPGIIKVLVATGLHRAATQKELDTALGRWKGILAINSHDAKNPDGLVHLGKTSLGTDISVNRTFMESEFKILTGDVEYHQFVGYGGGNKGVYPGLADAEAIRTNHSRMDLPGTGSGRIEGNPVRVEIDEVGRMARVDYNLSVAMDAQHHIVAARAGDPFLSFKEACRVIDDMYLVEVPRRAELVIDSPGGHPKDIDFYQSQKAMEEATLVVKPGGNVLTIARCDEGSGSSLFEQWMDESFGPEEIVSRIRENFIMGGHKAYQIAREVQRARLHLYSQLPPGKVRAWMMYPVRSVEDMTKLIAAAASVIVLPQATLTQTRLPQE
jgi:lactate racemase